MSTSRTPMARSSGRFKAEPRRCEWSKISSMGIVPGSSKIRTGIAGMWPRMSRTSPRRRWCGGRLRSVGGELMIEPASKSESALDQPGADPSPVLVVERFMEFLRRGDLDEAVALLAVDVRY